MLGGRFKIPDLLRSQMEDPDAFIVKVYQKVLPTISMLKKSVLAERKRQVGVEVNQAILKDFRAWMDTSETFKALPSDARSTITFVLTVFVATSLQKAQDQSSLGSASNSDNDLFGTQASANCRISAFAVVLLHFVSLPRLTGKYRGQQERRTCWCWHARLHIFGLRRRFRRCTGKCEL